MVATTGQVVSYYDYLIKIKSRINLDGAKLFDNLFFRQSLQTIPRQGIGNVASGFNPW